MFFAEFASPPNIPSAEENAYFDRVEVYDMMGQLVLQTEDKGSCEEIELDLTGERPGIYLVKVYVGNNEFTHRVMLQK